MVGSEDATFLEQHVRSFISLRRTRKKWGSQSVPRPNVRAGAHMILSRYLSAYKEFFSINKVKTLSIAFDASRVGGREILLCTLMGTSADGVRKI